MAGEDFIIIRRNSSSFIYQRFSTGRWGWGETEKEALTDLLRSEKEAEYIKREIRKINSR